MAKRIHNDMAVNECKMVRTANTLCDIPADWLPFCRVAPGELFVCRCVIDNCPSTKDYHVHFDAKSILKCDISGPCRVHAWRNAPNPPPHIFVERIFSYVNHKKVVSKRFIIDYVLAGCKFRESDFNNWPDYIPICEVTALLANYSSFQRLWSDAKPILDTHFDLTKIGTRYTWMAMQRLALHKTDPGSELQELPATTNHYNLKFTGYPFKPYCTPITTGNYPFRTIPAAKPTHISTTYLFEYVFGSKTPLDDWLNAVARIPYFIPAAPEAADGDDHHVIRDACGEDFVRLTRVHDVCNTDAQRERWAAVREGVESLAALGKLADFAQWQAFNL